MTRALQELAENFFSDEMKSLRPFLPYAEYLAQGFPSRADRYCLQAPDFTSSMRLLMQREHFYVRFGYVLATQELMDALVALLSPLGPVLDAGCGSGYLSAELGRRGVSTFAVDIVDRRKLTLNEVNAGPGVQPGSEVSLSLEQFQLDAVGSADDYLCVGFGSVLMTWPPYGDAMALQVAKAMMPGQLLVYEGEFSGGCTADDDFFAYVDDEAIWEPLENASAQLNAHHLSWRELHDHWMVWKKKT